MARKIANLIAGAGLLLLWASPILAAPCTLEDLGWMRGNWHIDTPERQTEERWVPGYGGMLIGSSWSMAKGKPPFIEAMTIAEDDKGVAMRLRHFAGNLGRAMEDKEVPMVFTLASCEAGGAIFDGEGKQAGEHLTYRRTGDAMHVIGDFIHDGKPNRFEFDFRRIGD